MHRNPASRRDALNRLARFAALRLVLPGLLAPCLVPGLPGAALAAAEAGKEPEEIRIAFMGDSMADGVWGGMVRLVAKEACLASRVKLGRFAENGTGLTRPSKFDWVGESKVIAAKFKPTLVVVSMGLNDRQSIVDLSRARFDLGTPGWRTRYRELAQAMIRNLTEASAGVLWLGIPTLRDKVGQDDAAEKNAVFAEAAKSFESPKVRFVGPWKQDSSGTDTFQPYGPDIKGAQTQIRAPDGIHFTAAGYDVVAAFLLRNAADLLKDQGVALTYPCQP